MKKLLLLLCLMMTQLVYSQVPTSGLTGEYRFTNGSLDDTANGISLVQTGSALSTTGNHAGGVSRAITLNGDHLQRTTNTEGNLDLSVSFWIKTSTNDAMKRVIIDQTERTSESETVSQTGWYIYLKDGKVGVAGNFQWAKQVVNIVSGTVYESTGFTGYLDTNSLTDISDGNWHHVVVTIFTNNGLRQGTAIRATYNVYVNDVLETTQNQTYTAPDHPWSVVKRFVNLAHPITIGNSKDGNSTDRFQESIDDIRFYSRTIDATDVNNLYSETACSGSTSATALAQDMSIQLDVSGNASISADDIDNGSINSCGDPVATLTLDKSTFTCEDLGTNTVTLTATDLEGNTSTATATVTVTPFIEVIMKSDVVIVELDGTGNASIVPADVDDGTFSSCGENLTFSLDRTDFSCADSGMDVLVTLSVSDESGNLETGTAIVRAEDTEIPVAAAQDVSVQLDAVTGLAVITTAMINNGSSDNCNAILTLSKTEFSCGDLGENAVTLTVTDDEGNVGTATATVTVTSIINDEAITAAVTEICPDGTSGTTISTASSVVGVDYYLRNSVDNSIVEGPVAGTGSALDFNTGMLSETTTFNVLGRLTTTSGSQALEFDGIDDYVNAGTDNRSITSQITVGLWIKTSVVGAQYFLGKYDGIRGILFYIDANGKANLDGRDGTGVYKKAGASVTSVNDDEWHYLAGTVDISTGVWSVYVDGVLESSTTHATGSTLAGTDVLTIGGHTTLYYAGAIDEVSIWNTALDQSAIQYNMNNSLGGSENGIVGLFKFNEGSGTTTSDASSYAMSGTLTNMDPGTDWITGPASTNVCGFQMSDEITIGDVTPPSVLVQNITIQQDESGLTTIAITDIDNGTTDNCASNENLTFSLNKSEFDCDETGANVVTLTVTDESGNESSADVTVTITSSISDQVVTATQSNVCPGESATVSIAGSQEMISYTLRNEAGTIIDGPIDGTGSAIDFTTGAISQETTFNVFGEPSSNSDQAMVVGSVAQVIIPSSSSLQLSENWTIEAWVKPSATVMNIVETYNGSGGYILRSNGSKWQAYAMQSSGSFAIVTSATSLVIDEWTHVAATFNETTNQLKIYVNGVLDATNSSATVDQRGSTTTIKLGGRGDDGSMQGAHTQDEVRIWNIERTDQEISDYMSMALSGSESGLVAYYNYNDLTFSEMGMTIPDLTSNGNDGTMTGNYTENDIMEGAPASAGCAREMSTTVTITAEDNEAPTVMTQNFTARLDINNQVTVFPSDVDNGSYDQCGSVSLQIELDNVGDVSTGSRAPEVITGGLTFNETNLGDNLVKLIVEDESGNTASASATVTVIEYKMPQAITFAELSNKVYGEAPFNLTASASSGLAVNLTVAEGPAVLSESTLTITGAGTVTIAASQEGDDEYAAALTVERSFAVSKATLIVSAEDKTITYGDALPELTFTYDGFVNEEGASNLTTEPTISTSAGSEEGQANAGSYVITLSGGESANYEFTLIDGTLTIDKANQVISIEPIEDKEPEASPFNVIASVDSDLELTYDVTGPATISGTTITLDGTEGTVQVTVSQAGDDNHHSSSSVESFDVKVILAVGDELSEEVKVYPNPAVNYIQVDTNKKVNLRFFGFDGRLVKVVNDAKGRIDLTDLVTGTYLLEVLTPEEKIYKRITKTN
ncbi:MAG: LamG-like jellyroll fold domain-containing protein [Cyclobacteriaceae bacterium]